MNTLESLEIIGIGITLIISIYAFYKKEEEIKNEISKTEREIDARLDILQNQFSRLEGEITGVSRVLSEFKSGLEFHLVTLYEKQNKHSDKIDEIKDELRGKLNSHFRDDLGNSQS